MTLQLIPNEKYKKGREEGRLEEILSLVEEGLMNPETAADRLEISVSELKDLMLEKGYNFPRTKTM